MTTSQNIDSIFSSLLENDEEQSEERDQINQMIGRLKTMNRMRLFFFVLQGEAIRNCRNKNMYEILLYSKVGKGNQELLELLIMLVDELESLVRKNNSIGDSLDQLIEEKYLERLEHLQDINKLN